MNIHSLLGAAAMACITVGTFILLWVMAEKAEQRAINKWWKENSPTNFDLDK